MEIVNREKKNQDLLASSLLRESRPEREGVETAAMEKIDRVF